MLRLELVPVLLSCRAGVAAPELSARLPGGRRLLLSEHRGKVVALSFIYTTCPHCQHASQTLNRLQKEYGPRGFQSLGVAFNEDAAKLLPAFVKQFGIEYPMAAGGPVLRCSAATSTRPAVKSRYPRFAHGRGSCGIDSVVASRIARADVASPASEAAPQLRLGSRISHYRHYASEVLTPVIE